MKTKRECDCISCTVKREPERRDLCGKEDWCDLPHGHDLWCISLGRWVQRKGRWLKIRPTTARRA